MKKEGAQKRKAKTPVDGQETDAGKPKKARSSKIKLKATTTSHPIIVDEDIEMLDEDDARKQEQEAKHLAWLKQKSRGDALKKAEEDLVRQLNAEHLTL